MNLDSSNSRPAGTDAGKAPGAAAMKLSQPVFVIPEDALIIVPVRNLVLFPGMILPVTIGREMAQVERYMNVLATAGSTATFVGLAGTVYGIMSSFTAIAAQQNTNLAVVAPGIAEALLSTLLGLMVAIPAVMAYNKFAADIGRYGERLDAFSSEFSAILSRHLEEKG